MRKQFKATSGNHGYCILECVRWFILLKKDHSNLISHGAYSFSFSEGQQFTTSPSNIPHCWSCLLTGIHDHSFTIWRKLWPRSYQLIQTYWNFLMGITCISSKCSAVCSQDTSDEPILVWVTILIMTFPELAWNYSKSSLEMSYQTVFWSIFNILRTSPTETSLITQTSWIMTCLIICHSAPSYALQYFFLM